jgi:hypothetical protein
MERQRVLCIDVGGVLSVKGRENYYEEHVNSRIDMPYALETLEKLNTMTITDSTGASIPKYRFVILSFCGQKRAIETQESLDTYPHLFKENYFVKDRYY